jgi:uncharacterized protein Yka (UPF0111/DUF47 family)
MKIINNFKEITTSFKEKIKENSNSEILEFIAKVEKFTENVEDICEDLEAEKEGLEDDINGLEDDIDVLKSEIRDLEETLDDIDVDIKVSNLYDELRRDLILRLYHNLNLQELEEIENNIKNNKNYITL